MKRILFFSILLMIVAACGKNKMPRDIDRLRFEKTFRLDTIDFNFGFFDSSFILRPQPYGSIFDYRLHSGNSIELRNKISSYSGFSSYYFKQDNSSQFSIGKFYNRPGLPATLQFQR